MCAEAGDRFVKNVRSVPRRVVLLAMVGLVVASVAAVIALAHGKPTPSATAKMGARVESDPSIRPVMAGCTRCSRNDFAESELAEVVVCAADITA